MNHKPKNDLLTGESFTPKRINQRFKTAANRIKYHNDKANERRHKEAYINRPLFVSHGILMELLKDKQEATFHKQFLAGKGFDFNVHTHLEEYKGSRIFALYNYLVFPSENEKITIIKK